MPGKTRLPRATSVLAVRPDQTGRRKLHGRAIQEIRHAPIGAGQPAVTFTGRTRRARRGRMARPPEAVDGLWLAHNGLWVAAAAGHYTHVRLTARSVTQKQRLRPVTEPPAAP